MEIRIEQRQNETICIILEKRFTLEEVPSFSSCVDKILQQEKNRISIDMSAIHEIDSSAIGELMKKRNIAKTADIDFSLLNVPEKIQAPLEAAGLHRLFDL